MSPDSEEAEGYRRSAERKEAKSAPPKRHSDIPNLSSEKAPQLPQPPPHIFTNEFHFEDALSFSEIEWDDVREFIIPPRDTTECIYPGRRRRRRPSSWDSIGFILILLVLNGPSSLKGKIKGMWKGR